MEIKEFYSLFWRDDSNCRFAVLDQPVEVSQAESLLRIIEDNCALDETSVIADIGCGKGDYAVELHNKFRCKVFAIDIVLDFLKIAPWATNRIVPLHGSFVKLPLPDDSVDLLFIRESFLYCQNMPRAFREFERVLKPDRWIFLYGAFYTELASKKDVGQVSRPLGHNINAMRHDRLLARANLSGFKLVLNVERELHSVEEVLGVFARYCRMLKHPDRYKTAFTAAEINLIRAAYGYYIFGVLGKLTHRVLIFKNANV